MPPTRCSGGRCCAQSSLAKGVDAAVCCVALAAVPMTSLPVLSDASGARAFLLVLRGFLGVTTLVSWFALLGDRPRLFQVSAIAVALRRPCGGSRVPRAAGGRGVRAAGGAAPARSGRTASSAGAPAPARLQLRRQVRLRTQPSATPAVALHRAAWRVFSPILFCLLVGAVLGCIQGVGADLVLAHEQRPGDTLRTTCWWPRRWPSPRRSSAGRGVRARQRRRAAARLCAADGHRGAGVGAVPGPRADDVGHVRVADRREADRRVAAGVRVVRGVRSPGRAPSAPA
ncbi:MAG: hypothetical protein ACLR3C_13935 [Eggerthella lenta]